MGQFSILLRLSHKVLIWAIIAGVIADFVVSKTVTRHPKENTGNEMQAGR